MFNSDVTQNYNHQDATLEILVMLAGAFLLGWLFSWLYKMLYATDQQNIPTSRYQGGNQQQGLVSGQQISKKSSTTHESSRNTGYGTPRIDDLTKIKGIDLKVQELLKNQQVHSYTDLRDINRVILKDIVISTGKNTPTRKDVETWPHQASLAAKGEWKKLSDYQAFIDRADASKRKPKNIDDLKKIEGIGPKIEEILNNKGIHSFKDLSTAESDTLKSHIVAADTRFSQHNTESWPHQAGMAEKGQWEELEIYQEFMDINDDSDPSKPNQTKLSNEHHEPEPSLTLGDTNFKENKDISSINNEYRELLKDDYKLAKTDKSGKLLGTEKDDLKKIEGIGPKIEEVLNDNGIYTFSSLYQKNRDTLKTYLDTAGPQFKMHEPESWPHQAGMADRGEWKELKIYQDFLDGGKEKPTTSSPISKEKTKSNKKNKTKRKANKLDKKVERILNDDFKKLEGIGPKIEALLKEAKILTFEDLMNKDRDTLKGILSKAGPQYRMHEPETWPLQAKMAYNNEWEKLKEYQDFLLGGRE